MMDCREIADIAVGKHGAFQDRDELSAVLSLAREYKVKRVIEIGTCTGATAWAFTQAPSVIQVITIDISWRYTGDDPLIQFIHGSSNNDETIARVRELLDGDLADFLLIDGGHEEVQVQKDWDNYSPMVRPGGIVVFHDINEWKGHPEIQVRPAWLRISRPYPHIELISDRETSPGTGMIWLTR